MTYFILQFNPDKYPNPHNALKKIAKKVAKSTEDHFDNVDEVIEEVYEEGILFTYADGVGATLLSSDGGELGTIN